MKIKNITQSTGTCEEGSWLEYWKKYSWQPIDYCAEYSCLKKELVGALVKKSNSADNQIYVVPLCTKHSKSTSELEAISTLIPVPIHYF